MRIVIIEDEKPSAKHLAKTILSIVPEAEIIAIIHSVEEAVAYFENPPAIDLIFSDIELSDGLSFEVFENHHIKTPIIFCTAFNHYALEAFKTMGIDYVLKPYSKETIAKALDKYDLIKSRFTTSGLDFQDLMEALKGKKQASFPSVLVYQGEKIIPLSGKSVALFFIENECCFAYTFEGQKLLLQQNLEQLEKLFSPYFFRANRQHLVNRQAVKDAAHYFNRKLIVNLNLPFSEEIIVGKLRITAFTEWLTQV